ncbi:4'-phosphopantetheinyl transferase family protein [Clostridium butyricum]
MTYIYILKISEFPRDRKYEDISLISSYRKRKMQKYRFIEDSYRCMIAELLVRYVLTNKLGYKNNELIFCISEYGKPYLKNQSMKEIHFNFSHSGKYVVCAIDSEQCGVDIEYIDNYNTDMVNNIFHIKEAIKLNQYNNVEKANKYFTFLWTMKEAYLKALGIGLSKSLSSFYIQKHSDKISIIDLEVGNRKFNVFESMNIENQYIVSYVGNNKPIYHYINNIELMNNVKKWTE